MEVGNTKKYICELLKQRYIFLRLFFCSPESNCHFPVYCVEDDSGYTKLETPVIGFLEGYLV